MRKKTKSKINKRKQPNHVADAIIGGVFGATVGWFYKREETQEAIKRIRESELYQNFTADVYQSAEENLREFITMNIENQTRSLLQRSTPSFAKKRKEEAFEEEDFDEEDWEDEEVLDDELEAEEYEDEDLSYNDLVEDNKQLKKAISKLEAKFEKLTRE